MDGQNATNFGHLVATRVPWVVVPDSFFNESGLPPNAVSAVVCDGKVFYGIMGDTDADDPEVMGEASLLMGNTCFPNDNLNGGNGHSQLDVLCLPLPNILTERYRVL
jgi:chitosanase